MHDLKDLVYIVATVIGVPSVVVTAWKTLQELKRSRKQREDELTQREATNRLKRAEFTLAQHRRLFDDDVLWSVLRKLDDDHPDLGTDEMWDAKRKFLTFFEELALLINSNLVQREVALYIFGYYAIRARDSQNFAVGIDFDPQFWGLFMHFSDDARNYFETFGPQRLNELSI